MKKDVMIKWVAALRSGEYKQGKTYLNRNNEYCCLGVLCEILEVPKRKDDYENGAEVSRYGGTDEHGGTSGLPESAKLLAGIKGSLGSYKKDDSSSVSYHALSSDNDNGTSFADIADIIEANWEKL